MGSMGVQTIDVSAGGGKQTGTDGFDWSGAGAGGNQGDGAAEVDSTGGVEAQSGFFTPTITGNLDFGDDTESFDSGYPSQQQKITLEDTSLRLTKILYKATKTDGYLAAIKLEYNNGSQSPWIENSRLNDVESQQKTIYVNPDVSYRKIGMKVDQTGRGFEGLRLIRSNGQKEFTEEWFVGKASKFNAAKWVD